MALSNASFRDFLSKKEEDEEKGKKSSAESAEERQRKKAKAQAAYERRMAIQKRREDALAEASKYTDRAAERRKEQEKHAKESGQEPEYFEPDADAEEPPENVSSAPTYAQLGDREDLAQQQHRVSIAQSKYLGGDIEHTHLVKGLDFALLQKMRSELGSSRPKEGKEGGKGAGKADAPAGKGGPVGGAAGAKSSLASTGSNAVKPSSKPSNTMAFATETGRDVYRAVFGTSSRPNKALVEGRLVLVFDISLDYAPCDLIDIGPHLNTLTPYILTPLYANPNPSP